MPLNILRLNEKRLHPTPHIIFIKSLPNHKDSAVAEEFLKRVAAICHPILKNHHLSVTTLEEFPPNNEFVGRNFNNGECIQLVLRTRSGGWVPFRAVVMVMMHELAHNVHMNHSRAFWAVRNEYAGEMRALWAKGYTGEGMWGPGRQAASGIVFGGGRELDGDDMPEHLCGGTYRSRRQRKRKKPKVSWKEQKERRIARKFGVNGQTLGEDTTERMSLQGFKGPTTKSKVAGSKRGRELRAAAALARFEKEKTQPAKEEEDDDDTGDGDEDEDEGEYEYDDPDADAQDAKDLDGSRMQDTQGQGLIRVCEDEDPDDSHVKEEMDELRDLRNIPWHTDDTDSISPENERIPATELRKSKAPKATSTSTSTSTPKLTGSSSINTSNRHNPPDTDTNTGKMKPVPTPRARQHSENTDVDRPNPDRNQTLPDLNCAACSMANEPGSLLCTACSNVLDPERSAGSWKCGTEACRGSRYLNPVDYGMCGVCGARKE